VNGTLTIRAHAKINLHLAIHWRRPDGYHELTTVLQSLALHDELTFEPSSEPFELRCVGFANALARLRQIRADDSNLVWRAGKALRQHVAPLGDRVPGVAVTLTKRVPVEAGLGGGSADAMAALRGLAAWWNLPLSIETLVGLGRTLGADVPFFAEGGTALGTGRGDELQPLPDLPTRYVAIVVPPVGVSTLEAYRWVAEARRDSLDCPLTPRVVPQWPTESDEWESVLPQLTNDFEAVVAARLPEVRMGLERLRACGAQTAFLTGSGSAVVGLFERQEAAEAAARAYEAPGGQTPGWQTPGGQTPGGQTPGWQTPGWQTMVTRTLSRKEYGERAQVVSS
jgi:4-diphosphocytidyl-2-C-methyl-D-erythritol kinase